MFFRNTAPTYALEDFVAKINDEGAAARIDLGHESTCGFAGLGIFELFQSRNAVDCEQTFISQRRQLADHTVAGHVAARFDR
jgi:hypothetical protein